MRAISLHQPWASAITAGIKSWETRSWYTTYRGIIIIHAAKTRQWESLIQDEPYRSDLAAAGINNFDDMPRGCAVGVAELTAVLKTGAGMAMIDLSDREKRWGNYGPGRWAWQLRFITPFSETIPLRGMQGLFDADIAMLYEIQAFRQALIDMDLRKRGMMK